MTSLVMVTVFALTAGWRDVERTHEQDAYDMCVADWAGALTQRSVALGAARSEVDGANDALWRTVADVMSHPGPDARDRVTRALVTYVDASNRYRDRVIGTPPPEPPHLACG